MTKAINFIVRFIRTRRMRVFVVSGVICVGAVIFLVLAGYYPVAIVDGSFITQRQFSRFYRAASIYSAVLEKVPVATSTPADILPPEIAQPLTPGFQALVLDQLVENKLVEKSLHREVGTDFDYLVGSRVSKFSADKNLQEAAQTLFGLSFSDFQINFLTPQAEREVLSGRLFLRGISFEDWIKDRRRDARISIFSSRLKWDGEKVTPQS